jgi:tRNA(Phe) wybutosine-synthesizing methylase Tyw3
MDLLEGGHKLIVFAHHREMLDVISETLLKKVNVHIHLWFSSLIMHLYRISSI